MIVERNIVRLLKDRECVVIPGFGSFVSHVSPPSINTVRGIIRPSFKNIAFNRLLPDDGVLLDWMIKNEKITELEAVSSIKVFVQNLKDALVKQRNYRLDEVGDFFLSDENEVLFQQFTKFNYLADSYGLPEVNAKPLNASRKQKPIFKLNDRPTMSEIEELPEDQFEENEEYSRNEEQTDEYDDDLKPKKKASYLWIYILGPILLLAVISGGYYFTNKEKIDSGNFNPFQALFSPAPEDTSSEKTNKVLPENQTTGEEISETPTDEAAAPAATEAPVSAKPEKEAVAVISDAIQDKTGRFYIVGGGFKSTNKALRLQEKAKTDGLDAKIIAPSEGSSVYRVTLGDFESLDEAHKKAADLRANYGDEIWVYQY